MALTDRTNRPKCSRVARLGTWGLCLLGSLPRAPADPWPLTVAEQSEFRATSRSEQVVEFIDQLTAHCTHLQRVDFGRTAAGRPLVAATTARLPAGAMSGGTPEERVVVLIVGNIHAGECDGKEALLMLLRDVARQPDHPWLAHLDLIVVPNFNADGNDRMRRDNRPGQVGPEDGMGERANAQGLDLNRDFMKLDSPECQHLVALINRRDPHILIDCHTTNGSAHRYPITYDVPHHPASPTAVRDFLRREMMPAMTRELQSRGLATFYYGNFNRDRTRWVTYGDEPRHSTEYFGLRGRLGILAESYAYISYKDRIVASYEFVRACLDCAAARHAHITQLCRAVRQDAVLAGGQSGEDNVVPLESEMAPTAQRVWVQGYQEVTDADGHRTNTAQPQDYEVEFWTLFRPTTIVPRPTAYILPTGERRIRDRLEQHGVALRQLARDTLFDVETYRITQVERAGESYQGHHRVRLTVIRQADRRQIESGSWVVDLRQPLGNLIVHLLEPQAVDSFAAWDLFEPPLQADQDYPILRVAEPLAWPQDAGPPSRNETGSTQGSSQL